MSSTLINQIVVAVVPMIGLLLPGVLKQDGLSDGINGGIAGIIVLLASIGTAYSADKLQIGNLPADFAVILAGMSSLLAGPLRPLDSFIQTNVANIIPGKKPATIASQGQSGTSDIASIITKFANEIKSMLPASPVVIHTTQAPLVQTPAASVPSMFIAPQVSETIAQPVANTAPSGTVTWQAQQAEAATSTNTIINPMAGATSSILTPGQQFIRHYGDTGLVPVPPKQG